MENRPDIRIDDFDYFLPEEKIAKYPLTERDSSRLLLYNDKKITESVFRNVTSYLPCESLVLFNNTKVVKARMNFQKDTGGAIEIFCLEPVSPADYSQIFGSKNKCTWNCLVGNLKKWKSGTLKKVVFIENIEILLEAQIIRKCQDAQDIEFTWNNSEVSFGELLEHAGNIPIPPYLNRKSENIDLLRYQTVYGINPGSVAAPTAGLHFTKPIIEELTAKKIKTDELTLHVGAGTFKPVQSAKISEHEMHHERIYLTKKNIKNILKYAGNITATGTTTVRTIESLYWLGVKMIENDLYDPYDFSVSQWEPYQKHENISVKQSLEKILDFMDKKNAEHITGTTQIMIVPGYEFRLTDRIITNFHQPLSTLLLLIAAFVGSDWKKIYEYALKNNFRFLSYGDSSLLFRK